VNADVLEMNMTSTLRYYPLVSFVLFLELGSRACWLACSGESVYKWESEVCLSILNTSKVPRDLRHYGIVLS
jgi:hypothetical protein